MAEESALLAGGTDVLVREAAYLDERRWDDWLALYAPDCEYWVPTWLDEDRLTEDPRAQLSHIYYNSRAGLEDRIARVRTRKSPASTPLRRTTHMLGNLILTHAQAGQITMRASWTCHVYDPHRQRTDVLFGHSSYGLRAEGGRWLIAKRKTTVQNDTLPAMVDFYCI